MSTINKRTKITKDSRVEFRCSKGFKGQLEELAVQNGLTLTKYLEVLCTTEIRKNLPDIKPIKNNKISKGRYIYHTPKGEFYGSIPAAEANGLTRHTLEKNCRNCVDGYSMELAE